MFRDLREFIEKVKEAGQYRLVEGADADLEIGAITHLAGESPEPSLLMFDRIKGYPPGFRVISNVFGSPLRTALGLGMPEDARGIELVRAFRDRVNAGITPIPPMEVKDGPVKENIMSGNDVDLLKFPAPKWHELDGGRYIGTGTMCIMKDPDSGWVNVGCYRVQVHDRNTATIQIGPMHHGDSIEKKYWKKGLACPAAVTCGQDPQLWLSSFWPAAYGVSEYGIAGGLRGAPVEVTRGVSTGLPIPATAEIVLEGEVVPPEVETRVEGPFGEWPGYYASGPLNLPAFKVKSVLYRNDPIIQGNPPSRLPGVWSLGVHIHRAAMVWSELDRQIAGVKGAWIMEDASSSGILVISLKQEYSGHAKQAALIAAGAQVSTRYLKFIIVVDEDIDPSNTSQVLWALGTRVDPQESINIITGRVTGPIDPVLSPEKKARKDFSRSLAVVLACKPYHWIDKFPVPIGVSPELADKTRKKWGSVLG